MQMRGCRSPNTWGDLNRGGAASCPAPPQNTHPEQLWGCFGLVSPPRSAQGITCSQDRVPRHKGLVLDALEEPVLG